MTTNELDSMQFYLQ